MRDVIEKAYAAGRWDWPDFKRPQLSDYACHVQELRTSAKDLERYGSDLYLALGSGMGDPQALRALREKHFPALEDVMARSGFGEVERQDVLQQTMLYLCAGEAPRMLTYAARASLASWLRITTLRFAINMRPRKGPGQVGSSDLALERAVVNEHDPELQVAIEHARPAFQTALQASIGALPERDKTLLRLCFLDGLTIDAIGSMYGVHRATAARWISEIRRGILSDVRSKLSRELGLGASEFESLAFLIRSQLQLSLIRVFGAA